MTSNQSSQRAGMLYIGRYICFGDTYRFGVYPQPFCKRDPVTDASFKQAYIIIKMFTYSNANDSIGFTAGAQYHAYRPIGINLYAYCFSPFFNNIYQANGIWRAVCNIYQPGDLYAVYILCFVIIRRFVYRHFEHLPVRLFAIWHVCCYYLRRLPAYNRCRDSNYTSQLFACPCRCLLC